MPVPLEQLQLFLVGSILITVVPGADMALVMRQVFIGGTSLAQRTIFGNLTGLVVHAVALAAGLSALLATSAEAYTVVKLAGASYRAEALQDDAFAPGRRLALVREPENEHDPNAVAVYDAERRLKAGYVPAEVAPEVRGDEQAVSLWEFRGENGQRIGLRVLLAPADAWIQEPRG